MVRAILLAACVCAFLAQAGAAEPPSYYTKAKPKHKVAPTPKARCRAARAAIPYYRNATRSWQRKRQASQLVGAKPRARHRSCSVAKRAAKEWRLRAIAAHKSYHRWKVEQARIARDQATRRARSLYAKWECIHLHEGAWNDPNAPYYGGLQMDYGFQQTYGSEFLRRYGTADRWPVWAQIQAAERAFNGYRGHERRGFTPWPNTARACGLL